MARAVVRTAYWAECADVLELGDTASCCTALLLHAVEKVGQAHLLISPQHEVNPFNGSHRLGLELRIAACYNDVCAGMLPDGTVYGLTVFLVGHISDRTGVYYHHIGLLAAPAAGETGLGQRPPYRRTLGEIQLAAEGYKLDFLT